jgi:hypothetical protein
MTIHRIEVILERYRSQMDLVGDRMSGEIIQEITKHNQQMLENNK